MAKVKRLIYPEIECWSSIGVGTSPKPTVSVPIPEGPTYYIDILEVTAVSSRLQKCLDDSSVRTHLRNMPLSQPNDDIKVLLRILFIGYLNLPFDWMDPASTSIASWMMDSFGVSPLFFQLMTPEVKYRHDGGTSFPTREREGRVTSLDGFYQISAGIRFDDVSFLWFKHALLDDNKTVASTYICYKCPVAAKQKIIALVDEKPAALLRPLALDALIVAERLNNWGEALREEHSSLRYYIKKLPDPSAVSEQSTETVHNLRHLAEHFHVIRTILEDTREHIDYLFRMHQSQGYSHLFQSQRYDQEYGAVRESLAYLLSQTKTMTRWVTSYVDHTDIIMNHLFNLFSLSIAISTQQDSSSMITMAAVTMFFLPGTFVSALFSMVFFNANEANTGLSVNSQLWLFFAVTVPLTVAVFAIWELWRRTRQAQQDALRNKQKDLTVRDAVDAASVAEIPTFGLSEMRQSPSLASGSIIPGSRSRRSVIGSTGSIVLCTS